MKTSKINALCIMIPSLLILMSSFIVSDNFVDQLTIPRQFYVLFTIPIIGIIYILKDWKKKPKWYITQSDLLFLAYYIYLIVHAVFSSYNAISLKCVAFLVVPLAYFIGKQTKINLKERLYLFDQMVVWIMLAHCLICILQLVDIFSSFHSAFSLTGMFGNPGPNAIYLAALTPIVVSCALNKKSYKFYKILSLITLLLTIFIVIYSLSRTAWLALGIYTLCFFYAKSRRFQTLWKRHRKLVFILLSVIFITGAYYAYQLKAESAQGRLFVWSRTLEVIAEAPLFGHGFDTFEANYNEAKSAFFESEENITTYKTYANSLSFAMNDYLQLMSEFGIVALILLLVLLYKFFQGFSRRRNPYYWVLIIILIASITSYPLQIIPHTLLFFFILGFASDYNDIEQQSVLKASKFMKSTVLFTLLALFAFGSIMQYPVYKSWKKAYVLVRQGASEKSLAIYNEVEDKILNDKYFNYNYGSELLRLGSVEESLEFLEKARKDINDEDVYCKIGDAYEKLGDITNATLAFEKAYRIMPEKIYARYRLISLYYNSGDKKNAIELAYKLLNDKSILKTPKSQAILQDISIFLEWTKE